VDAQRAVATYQALQDNLYLPKYRLYEKSDPSQMFGYLWDFVNPWAATNYMAAIPGIGDRYQTDMQARDQGVLDYYDTQETSPTGQPQPPAFASGVLRPVNSDQPTYYDDNAWVGLNFLQEYDLTHRQPDLTRAGHLSLRRERVGYQDHRCLPRRRVLGGRRQLPSQHHLQRSQRGSRAPDLPGHPRPVLPDVGDAHV
jgi:hypothetical protein